MFNYNDKFLSAQKHCETEGNKVVQCTKENERVNQINVIDTYVKSVQFKVLIYGILIKV